MIGRALATIALLVAAGCQGTRVDEGPGAVARFFLEARAESVARVTLPVSEVELSIEAKPVLTEYDFAAVEVGELELGKCLVFRMTPEAARDLYRLTVANQGRRLVLAIDGEAWGARPIEAPIEDGVLAVFVEVPETALPELARKLAATTARMRAEGKR